MAKDKKELDDDLLTGGKTLSSDADNKKAEKKKQAAAKKAEKNAAKLAAKKEKLLKEIEACPRFFALPSFLPLLFSSERHLDHIVVNRLKKLSKYILRPDLHT